MSILKSILHRYNTTIQDYDTLHPETEHAQVTDFGNGVLAHLLDSTLVSAVTAVSTGSLFGKLVEKLLEASGVQYNFQNSNAWYICLGDLFGGLIIQGGSLKVTTANIAQIVTLPLASAPFSAIATSTVVNQTAGVGINAASVSVWSSRNDAVLRWVAFCQQPGGSDDDVL